jgi:peptidoglycan-N-acetylglucosamine deacetylase
MKKILFILFLLPAFVSAQKEKTIVLTFDDAVKSQYTVVAPLLRQYGFGATFYVCEFPGMFGDTANSMSWEEIQQLSKWGFEIGNHTWHHRNLPGLTSTELNSELSYIENKCDSLGIPKLTSFCYPAYHTDSAAIPVLKQHGYTTARTGGDKPWDLKKDDPLYVPSFTITGDDSAYFYRAIAQAEKGKVVVFTIHGVPDKVHPWVTTPPEVFKKYMKYLYDHQYHVIAMRDLKIKAR